MCGVYTGVCVVYTGLHVHVHVQACEFVLWGYGLMDTREFACAMCV